MIHLDFETFSEAPLRACGAYRYSIDKTTEILCACYAIADGDVQTWVPCISEDEAWLHELPEDWHYGPKVPEDLELAVRMGERIIAHNAQFERFIWQNVVVKRHGGPPTKAHQFVCTAARSAAAGLPRSLEGSGGALGVKQIKDVENSKMLKIFAMVRKPSKKDPRKRIKPLEDTFSFVRLVTYCQQDVRAERDIDDVLPQLHPFEESAFRFDMQINERGLLIDVPLVVKASSVLSKLEADIASRVRELTICEAYPEGLRATQRDKMLDFFKSTGVELENMKADHVRKYMKDNKATLTPVAKELLLLRMEASKASTKKLVSMRAYTGPDMRARGTLLYYGAHTGRWSGKGIQPHNFIRGKLKLNEQERVFKLLQEDDHEIFELFYEWPISTISQCMRGFIHARPGHILRVVDYSSIEARVLAWMALQNDVLEAYRKGMDVYKLMASKLFGVPYEEVTDEQRRIGKNLVLGCGYGLGAAKFVSYSENAGVEITEEFAKTAVRAYREGHRAIVRYWGDVERCAISAVQQNATAERPVVLRNLRFYIKRTTGSNFWLCVELPSGRCLHYFRPKVSPVMKWGEPALQLTFRTEFRGRLLPESTYGGKLVENIVQAVARDLLVCGMFAAEEAGYPVIGTVHDEILTEPKVDFGSVKELEKIVCKLPDWAAGLPVGAEGFEGFRYRKG